MPVQRQADIAGRDCRWRGWQTEGEVSLEAGEIARQLPDDIGRGSFRGDSRAVAWPTGDVLRTARPGGRYGSDLRPHCRDARLLQRHVRDRVPLGEVRPGGGRAIHRRRDGEHQCDDLVPGRDARQAGDARQHSRPPDCSRTWPPMVGRPGDVSQLESPVVERGFCDLQRGVVVRA